MSVSTPRLRGPVFDRRSRSHSLSAVVRGQTMVETALSSLSMLSVSTCAEAAIAIHSFTACFALPSYTVAQVASEFKHCCLQSPLLVCCTKSTIPVWNRCARVLSSNIRSEAALTLSIRLQLNNRTKPFGVLTGQRNTTDHGSHRHSTRTGGTFSLQPVGPRTYCSTCVRSTGHFNLPRLTRAPVRLSLPHIVADLALAKPGVGCGRRPYIISSRHPLGALALNGSKVLS